MLLFAALCAIIQSDRRMDESDGVQLRPAGGHQPGAVLLLRSWLGNSHGRTRDGEHHQHGQNDCGGECCRHLFFVQSRFPD